MSAATLPTAIKPPPPPLRDGDRLDDAEYARRYWATDEKVKAELIEGVVYMASPITAEAHGDPHADLVFVIGMHRIHTPGTKASDNATVRLAPKNWPQPDASLRILASHGGTSKDGADGLLTGATEWAGEISNSSVHFDLKIKKAAYEKHGVQEYLVWRVEDRTIDWFTMESGEFVPLRSDAEGIRRSRVFPGLWLDAAALIRGDMQRVLEVLNQGLASAEHAAFVVRLEEKAKALLDQPPPAPAPGG